MPNNVTVQSAHGTTVTLAYDSGSNALLAEYVANAIRTGISGSTITQVDSNSGSPPPLFGGKTGEWVQLSPDVVMVPKGYDYIVDAAPATTLIDQNPDTVQSVLAGSGNLIFDASGAGSVIAGPGNDEVIVPVSDSGSWFIALGMGNDTVKALGGGHDTISVGSGNDSIQLSTIGSASDSITTYGPTTITAYAGTETVTGYGSDVIYGGGSNLTFVGVGGATIFGGTGSDTVTGGSGPDYLQGGSAGNNLITAGIGAATLLGGGGGDSLYASGSGAQILFAGGGNETLTGSSVSGANDTFVAGKGSATVVASPNANNVFEFVNGSGGGSEFVTGLSLSSQVSIHLSGFGPGEQAADLGSETHVPGGSTNLTLSDGTTVTFQNVATITSSNFS
jgi:Ca2+-binding RTX toxin-like protein